MYFLVKVDDAEVFVITENDTPLWYDDYNNAVACKEQYLKDDPNAKILIVDEYCSNPQELLHKIIEEDIVIGLGDPVVKDIIKNITNRLKSKK